MLKFLSLSPGNEAMSGIQQVTTENTVTLRKAPPPPNNRQMCPENFNTARFDIVRDDNEFLMFDPEPETTRSKEDDFSFEKIHEEMGKPILQAMSERRALREQAEKPLIFL
jgi:hypothetical protein